LTVFIEVSIKPECTPAKNRAIPGTDTDCNPSPLRVYSDVSTTKPRLRGTGVKKPVSKEEIRRDLQREVDSFLEQGGEVQNIPRGTSGKDPTEPPHYLNRRLFIEPKPARTRIPEVIAAIESRRKGKPHHSPVKKSRRTPQPRRKVIYDDFGEPLRKVWIEE